MLNEYPKSLANVVDRDPDGKIQLKKTATKQQRQEWERYKKLLAKPTIIRLDNQGFDFTNM